jgi:hypothetical protein
VLAVLFMVLAVLSGGAGVGLLVLAVREWQGKGKPPSDWLRFNSLKDAESLAGWDRSVLPNGLGCLSAAVLIGNGAINGARPSGAGLVIELSSLLATMIFSGLAVAILNFNRPRFLVPPHLRGQLGAIAGRRRRRREHLPML